MTFSANKNHTKSTCRIYCIGNSFILLESLKSIALKEISLLCSAFNTVTCVCACVCKERERGEIEKVEKEMSDIYIYIYI